MRQLFAVIVTCLAVHQAISQEENTMQLGVYVVVSELSVARQFYQAILQSPVIIENDDFVGFSVNGALFGLFTESAFSHDLRRGNNAIPYIQVEDIEAEFQRISALNATIVHDDIVREGPISLFMFNDPDGNALEFFALDMPQ